MKLQLKNIPIAMTKEICKVAAGDDLGKCFELK
jgi:hypothetical protein